MTLENIKDYSDLWVPQEGAQRAVYECPVQEICMGGSRGGGKSDAGIGLWLRHLAVNEELGFDKHCKGLVLRRTLNELKDLTDRAEEIFKSHARWWASTRTFEFANGASIQFSYLERDKDAKNYQGKQYTFLWFEEAGLFSDPRPLDMVKASLRSPYPVKKVVLYTCNPGGPGHSWLKQRFVDPNPMGYEIIENPITLPNGKEVIQERIFIPSVTEDNKILLENDPEYQARLYESTRGQPHLERAWIFGDWNIVAGGMFDTAWDSRFHVLPTFTRIPREWTIFRSYDWGRAKPFSIGWWARTDGTPVVLSNGQVRQIARNSLIKLGEWYGAKTEVPNTGLDMLEGDIADRVVQREKAMFPNHRVMKGPADHNIFIKDGIGRSDEDEWRKRGIRWKPADKERVKGWGTVREMLINAKEERPEKPGLYFTDTCNASLRFLPVAPRLEGFPDDIDPDYEDHVLDEIRYACAHKIGGGVSYVQVC